MTKYTKIINETIFNGCFRNIDEENSKIFLSNIQTIEGFLNNEKDHLSEKEIELMIKLVVSERVDEFDLFHLNKLKSELVKKNKR